ncbi:MAG: DUF4417 domain-containing protein [Clostridiales bacterium]|jgi:hypothetical protein|nr:DUF4417 domain-containing protein [Clostridiales bacterium]
MSEKVEKTETDEPKLSTLQSVLNYNLIENAERIGKYELPRLKKSNAVAYKAIRFGEIGSDEDDKSDKWVHFYAHDKTFEAIWNNPQNYLEKLKEYEGVITPDFSMYSPFTFSMQLWNTHRNRVIAYWLQENGVKIIPNVSWGLKNSYEFCFVGIEKGGTVAINTIGCITNRVDRIDFKNGLAEMIRQLTPETIIVYGTMPLDIFEKHIGKGIKFIRIPHTFKTDRVAEIVAETSNHRFQVGNEIIEKLSTETFDDLIMATGDISLKSEVTR